MTPICTKRLVRLAGYHPNTYARDAVTQLCRLGLLVRTPDGIRLPPGTMRAFSVERNGTHAASTH